MSGKLKALKAVATLDSQILELEKKSRTIPALLEQEEGELAGARKNLAAKEAEVKDLRVKAEIKEKDLQAAEQGVIKLRAQIGQAKSNKEYQALQHEILSKEADNARIEDAVLVQMQKVDKQIEERNRLAAEVKKTEAALAKERTEVEKELERIAGEIEKLRRQRNVASKDVPPDILGKYDRLISRRGQTAMVAVVHGACQGCFMQLRPETMAQLRKGTDLVFCHSCARILYLEDEN